MAKKIKTATPTINGRFAKLDKDWVVVFPSDVKITKGTLVPVVTVSGDKKEVLTTSAGVVVFDLGTQSVGGETFYTFERVAKK